MLTLLFVDDEPNILHGLQRMLRPMRHEWALHFAQSGEEALALLAKTEVDVIIADMQMPGMDGAELLRQVRQKYPHIARLIFSGYAERTMVMRSIGVAHQYLSKPCEFESLILTIRRACTMQHVLSDLNLRQAISQMKTVPSLPHLYNEVMQELQAPEPCLNRISALIQQDIGMTVKILQIINSAFFGLRRDISDISSAIALLGLETISVLVLSIGVFSQLQDKNQQAAIDQLWQHSLTVGRRAQAITMKAAPAMATDAYTAGLLHDIGRVLILANMPTEYLAIQDLVATQQLTNAEAEYRVLGIHQTALGAYLLELWGLPSPIVEAVAFFQAPSKAEACDFRPLTAVHLANALTNFSEEAVLAHPAQYLDVAYLQNTDVLDQLPLWLRTTAEVQASVA